MNYNNAISRGRDSNKFKRLKDSLQGHNECIENIEKNLLELTQNLHEKLIS